MTTIFGSSSHGNDLSKNQTIECWCSYPVVPGDDALAREDAARHAAQHAEFLRVVSWRQQMPASSEAREEMKDRGRKARRTALTLDGRIAGAVLELQGYRERSYATSIQREFGMEHPDLDGYIRYAAEIDMLGDAEISAELRQQYRHVAMPLGRIVHTEWEP